MAGKAKAPAPAPVQADNVNLVLWNAVCKTDPATTQKVNKGGGRSITAICAQAQRRAATAQFGPMGYGFGIVPESEHFGYNNLTTLQRDGSTTETILATYDAVLFYRLDSLPGLKMCSVVPEDAAVPMPAPAVIGRLPIGSCLKLKYMVTPQNGKPYDLVDDEYKKKLRTDALTKGLSELGFNADIFEGKYDDNRYVQQMKAEFAAQAAAPVQTPAPAAPAPAPVQTPPATPPAPAQLSSKPEDYAKASDPDASNAESWKRAAKAGSAAVQALLGCEKEEVFAMLKNVPPAAEWESCDFRSAALQIRMIYATDKQRAEVSAGGIK